MTYMVRRWVMRKFLLRENTLAGIIRHSKFRLTFIKRGMGVARVPLWNNYGTQSLQNTARPSHMMQPSLSDG